jgi:hypothetical protein
MNEPWNIRFLSTDDSKIHLALIFPLIVSIETQVDAWNNVTYLTIV